MPEPADIDELVQGAGAWFERGNLVLADFLNQEAFDQNPEHIGALSMMGELNLALGLVPQAIETFERVLRQDPDYKNARNNLKRAQQRPARRAYTGARYLLIKSWGYGFWSDVSNTLACLLLAEILDRTPVIHWGRNSLFRGDPEQDSFGLYFEPVSDITMDDLVGQQVSSIYPNKWLDGDLRDENHGKWDGPSSRMGALNFFNRPESIAVCDFYISVIELLSWLPLEHPMHGKPIDDVFRYLTAKYLKPRYAIADEARAFYETHLAGQQNLAVHIRGLDKYLEAGQAEEVNQSYLVAIDREPADCPIFLMTDDTRWLKIMRERYGDRVITTDFDRAEGNIGLHLYATSDRFRLGREVMVDCYIALQCDRFIGNGQSSVSAMFAVMKAWPNDACQLLTSPDFHIRNYFLYMQESPSTP